LIDRKKAPVMATETLTDLELFHRFVGKELAAGDRRMSVQECLVRYEAYQRDLAKLEEALRPAIEEFERGKGGPIDWDELKTRVRLRLAQQGIVDEATRSA
jgi:hypothetical protein